jgi:hypothetical protein
MGGASFGYASADILGMSWLAATAEVRVASSVCCRVWSGGEGRRGCHPQNPLRAGVVAGLAIGEAVDGRIVRVYACRYSGHVVVATAEVRVASSACSVLPCVVWERGAGVSHPISTESRRSGYIGEAVDGRIVRVCECR